MFILSKLKDVLIFCFLFWKYYDLKHFFKLKTSSFGKSAGFRYTYTYIKKILLNMCWSYVFPKLKTTYITFEIFYKKYMLCTATRHDGSEANGNAARHGNAAANRNATCYGYAATHGVWHATCHGKHDVTAAPTRTNQSGSIRSVMRFH